MRRSVFVLLLALCFCHSSGGQTRPKFNLDFEESSDKHTADGWIKWGPADFAVGLDSTQVYSGKFSMLITPQPWASSPSFGSGAFPLDANYRAKTVRLEGFMKIEDVDGFAGLLLRIDGENKTLQFDNMQDQKIHGTHDWKKYSITLPFPQGADKIIVAGILQGKGRAWFDSFEVFLDDKRIQDAKEVNK